MIHNLNNFVNEFLGSSLTFSAHGWWGKEKNCKPAEKIAGGSEGAAEGGWGGNSASPEPKRSPAALTEALRAETSKNIFFSLVEKNWWWRAKSKNVKKMFLLGMRALRAAAGRSDWFRSAILDKMSSSQTVKTHQPKTRLEAGFG